MRRHLEARPVSEAKKKRSAPEHGPPSGMDALVFSLLPGDDTGGALFSPHRPTPGVGRTPRKNRRFKKTVPLGGKAGPAGSPFTRPEFGEEAPPSHPPLAPGRKMDDGNDADSGRKHRSTVHTIPLSPLVGVWVGAEPAGCKRSLRSKTTIPANRFFKHRAKRLTHPIA